MITFEDSVNTVCCSLDSSQILWVTMIGHRLPDITHMALSPRPSPSFYEYCKRSKTGGGKSLGTRLLALALFPGFLLLIFWLLTVSKSSGRRSGLWITSMLSSYTHVGGVFNWKNTLHECVLRPEHWAVSFHLHKYLEFRCLNKH